MLIIFKESGNSSSAENLNAKQKVNAKPGEENSSSSEFPLITPLPEETSLPTSLKQEQAETANKVNESFISIHSFITQTLY